MAENAEHADKILFAEELMSFAMSAVGETYAKHGAEENCPQTSGDRQDILNVAVTHLDYHMHDIAENDYVWLLEKNLYSAGPFRAYAHREGAQAFRSGFNAETFLRFCARLTRIAVNLYKNGYLQEAPDIAVTVIGNALADNFVAAGWDVLEKEAHRIVDMYGISLDSDHGDGNLAENLDETEEGNADGQNIAANGNIIIEAVAMDVEDSANDADFGNVIVNGQMADVNPIDNGHIEHDHVADENHIDNGHIDYNAHMANENHINNGHIEHDDHMANENHIDNGHIYYNAHMANENHIDNGHIDYNAHMANENHIDNGHIDFSDHSGNDNHTDHNYIAGEDYIAHNDPIAHNVHIADAGDDHIAHNVHIADAGEDHIAHNDPVAVAGDIVDDHIAHNCNETNDTNAF